ncbi:MAG TPA: TlpA disulfide reductase family protein [Chitinophagales bacterium]|nr:TlpA disulfide reductase family protein [Chitinophagales bacterium]
MIKIFRVLLLSFFIPAISSAQELQSLSYNDLDKVINNNDGKAKVINFWATWCKPCNDELPAFVKAAESYPNVEFIFVSVDFQSQTQKVKDKIKELSMKGILVQMNEQGGEWIGKLDKNWSGAIPFTILILPTVRRVYHYDWFENYDALKTFLDKNLSN